MRSVLICYGTLDEAMQFAEQIEVLSNVHVTGFTQKSDGSIEIHFEENENGSSVEPSTELEYVDDDNWPDEYIDYPDWDEDE